MGVDQVLGRRRARFPLRLQVAQADGVPGRKHYSDAPLPPASVSRFVLPAQLCKRYFSAPPSPTGSENVCLQRR